MADGLPTVGVIGANGFIGSRIVEMFHLGSLATVRPIVRSISSLSRASRFALDVRVADAFDASALRQALDGCDTAIHAIAGDRRTILGTLAPAYRAAMAAGVRRLVYLSSACVHGQAPAPGTRDESPIRTGQAISYNDSKVMAERKLWQLRRKGSVEIVILRPGIVFGPRSYWTGGLADELLGGRAYFVGAEDGICNSIYVDNLVHAIHLAATAPNVDGQAFLVGDRETVTWREFSRPIVEALGMDLSQIPILPFPERVSLWRDPVGYIKSSERIMKVLSALPAPIWAGVRAAVHSVRSRSAPWSPWEPPSPIEVVPTLERALLNACRYKLPWSKAAALLGYEPIVSFEEGCRRSIAWLTFAGYAVSEVEWAKLPKVEPMRT